MSKADDRIKEVTDRLIAMIEEGSHGQWKMPWQTVAGAETPRNVRTGRFYRGFNILELWLEAMDKGYTSGLWGTMKAWNEKGYRVRKGEHPTTVILWKPVKGKKVDEDGEEKDSKYLLLRSYGVFAAEQIDGYEVPERDERTGPERIAEAEAWFAGIGADVQYGGNRAAYSRQLDTILCPELRQFDNAEHFYSTLAHEHVHWTGHSSRLDRVFGDKFGDDKYAAEELVAELGAAMIAARLGIEAATREDHASYLAHWLHVLREVPRALVTVMSKAQRAVDFLDELATAEAEVPEAA